MESKLPLPVPGECLHRAWVEVREQPKEGSREATAPPGFFNCVRLLK